MFSKKGFAIPIKFKYSTNTTKALIEIIELKLFANSIHKASIVERFNKTIKTRLYRAFTNQKSTNYIKILQNIISSYNKSFHSSIKTKPNLVTKQNEKHIFKILYNDPHSIRKENRVKIKYKKGTYVRYQSKKFVL